MHFNSVKNRFANWFLVLFTDGDVFTSWEMPLNVSRNAQYVKNEAPSWCYEMRLWSQATKNDNNEEIKEWKAHSLLDKESIVEFWVFQTEPMLPPSQFLSTSQTIIPNLCEIAAIRLKREEHWGETEVHQKRSTFDKKDLSCKLRSSDLRTLRTLSLCFKP